MVDATSFATTATIVAAIGYASSDTCGRVCTVYSL